MVNRVELSVTLGEKARPVGRVSVVDDGSRTFSLFEYTHTWLKDPKSFPISPELPLAAGPHVRKPATPADPCFFFSLADSAPGAWGRKILDRARARSSGAESTPATALDYLCAVEDTFRLGALRVQRDAAPAGDNPSKPLTLPGLADLPQALGASWALEKGNAFNADWDFLLRYGTSLGGSRPKICLRDDNGTMALAKLPRLKEDLCVPVGEVLSLTLARRAGLDVVQARIVRHRDRPVAVIQRFDREPQGGRKPYISAATLLQARPHEVLGYADLLGAMRRVSPDFPNEARELWRRLVFNLLTTNVDDHLHNLGFLYAGRGQGQGLWRLAPAFDLNPFPLSPRVSRTPLSRAAGPIRSIDMLLDQASMFELTDAAALSVVSEVAGTIKHWRRTGQSSTVGGTREELKKFEAAFEHDELEKALRLSASGR